MNEQELTDLLHAVHQRDVADAARELADRARDREAQRAFESPSISTAMVPATAAQPGMPSHAAPLDGQLLDLTPRPRSLGQRIARQLRHHPVRTLAPIAAVAAASVMLILVIRGGGGEPSGTIETCHRVGDKLNLAGAARNIPALHRMYVAVEGNDGFWPKEPPFQPNDGRWSVAVEHKPADYGPSGALLSLWVVSPEGHDRIQEWLRVGKAENRYPALPGIPGGKRLATFEWQEETAR